MAKVTLDQWVQQNEARLLAIWKESTQRLISRMQSRIPVDTGFARASARASLTAMPEIDSNAAKPDKGTTVVYDPSAITAVIASAKIGDKFFFGWTANYVNELEKGHSQQAPSGFIRVSLLEWPQIVKEVTEEAKARANG
jgi:hypothetical protein